MVGHDGHRGTVYYVATDQDWRGHGFGREMMAAAEDWLAAKGIWKLNLLIRGDNATAKGFYEAL
ncbi:GNAT family N-acetyltransferase, partial [Rhodoplanes roseus]